jgi:hypothetical protein
LMHLAPRFRLPSQYYIRPSDSVLKGLKPDLVEPVSTSSSLQG